MKRTTSTRKRTEKEPYLKGKNAVYLWSFIGINVAAFLCLLAGTPITEASLDYYWRHVTIKSGFIAAGVPILGIVLSAWLGNVGKARVVFWRWKDPLPGCRAFSELLAKDPRISVAALKAKIGEFPVDPREQNTVWYNLYRKHKAAVRVVEAHKVYLLTRDMAAIAAAFAIALPFCVFLQSENLSPAEPYAVFLFVLFLLISTAARNYGERFVVNVLVEEIEH